MTNLTSNDLIMEIVQSLFIHRFIYFSHIYIIFKKNTYTLFNPQHGFGEKLDNCPTLILTNLLKSFLFL